MMTTKDKKQSNGSPTLSTQKLSQQLIEEIKRALASIQFGSIEIFVQDKIVTQITVRNIKKTSVSVDSDSAKLTSSSKSGIKGFKIPKTIKKLN